MANEMNTYESDYLEAKVLFKKTVMVVPLSIILLLLLFYKKSGSMSNTFLSEKNGLVVKKSKLSFDATYEKLRNSLEANPNLKIILELDHSKNAASKELTLRPTRLIVFGNPLLGSPLMQTSPTLAIDLPQKIIVYQLKNGVVEVAYNDPQYLKERHQIEGKDEILNKVTGALSHITEIAIGN